jgi:uncharacterized protein (DUF1778 family)
MVKTSKRTAGKNSTDGVLEAARRAAADGLLDRTLLSVSPKAYAKFLKRLQVPPQPNDRLRRTMQAQARWDRVSLSADDVGGYAGNR